MTHLFFVVWSEEHDGSVLEFAEPRIHPTFLAAQDDRVWCMQNLDQVVPPNAVRPDNSTVTGRNPRDPRGPHVTEIRSPHRARAAA